MMLIIYIKHYQVINIRLANNKTIKVIKINITSNDTVLVGVAIVCCIVGVVPVGRVTCSCSVGVALVCVVGVALVCVVGVVTVGFRCLGPSLVTSLLLTVSCFFFICSSISASDYKQNVSSY